jgi:CheY-like chemotaxis protein
MRETILILEDSQSRLTALKQAITSLGPNFCVRVWSDAPRMIAEMDSYLPESRLISLDWHLRPVSAAEPGTGYDVMRHLSKRKPVAPVILHSSAILESTIMRDELRGAGWQAEQVILMENQQVATSWLPKAKELLSKAGL